METAVLKKSAKELGVKKRVQINKKQNKQLLVLCLPAIAFFITFAYMPMYGIILAFKHYRFDKGILGSSFVGFDNFVFFFTSQDALRVTRNTVFLNILGILLGMSIAVILAMILNEVKSRPAIKTYQTIMLMPHFLSMSIVAYIVFGFLNMDLGIFNVWLKRIGMEPIMWYSEPKYWITILTSVRLWHNVGYSTLIYYAAIIAIDKEYYESAYLDGAGRFKAAIHITLPMLMPMISVLFVMNMGRIFHADFGLFNLVTLDSSMLYPVTDVIDTYVFRMLKSSTNLGQSTAVSLYQSFVGFILVIITNIVAKKIDSDNGLF